MLFLKDTFGYSKVCSTENKDLVNASSQKKKSVWGKSHLENAVFRKDVTASCILDG